MPTTLLEAHRHSTRIPADGAALRAASAWLVDRCLGAGVSESGSMRLELCLNEAVANIIEHGGLAGTNALITLELAIGRTEATLVIIDGGHAFDPLQTTAVPLPSTLADAVPGGLGIGMLRSFSDSQRYERCGEHNRLTLTVNWDEAG